LREGDKKDAIPSTMPFWKTAILLIAIIIVAASFNSRFWEYIKSEWKKCGSGL
jgi:uncharacterized phage infection (PIP) family protein YhgE